ncbi:hypothetical protein [Amycolatopsis sp.]|uniref:hypothetical protein n=1 Tax=Amycolatopsis sp. TaxID=37632 RepID=UPI002B7627A1|nr:hypothetical protein [Amycolatopsis sp.]HVV11614.1 hypothetical protein [Amycolatopsis sp.]
MSNDNYDPFADDAPDEAQQGRAPSERQRGSSRGPWDDEASAPAPAQGAGQPITINAGGEGKLVATFKGGSGFEAPWLVVHAKDLTDLEETLSDGKRLAALLTRIKRIGATFAGKDDASGGQRSGGQQSRGGQQQRGGGSSQQRNERPAGKPEAADGPPRGVEQEYCDHGDMIWRTGYNEQKKKSWGGFFCPLPRDRKDEQCDPVFPRRGR